MKRGFTLIELMVVIGVVGLLASITLVAMGPARGGGRDASVKANLATIQVQGSLYYNIGTTFGVTTQSCTPAAGSVFNDTTTTVDDTTKAAITEATKQAKDNAITCKATATMFAVAAKLNNNKYWCIDSRNAAREITDPATISNASPLCPAS